MRRRVKELCLFGLFVTLLLPLVFAQGERGAITGVVTDESGGVIPGAEVTAVNKRTGDSRSTVTSETGVYRIPYLPPSTYLVAASQPGFKVAEADNVIVGVASVVTVDFSLEIGELTQTVTVSSEAPLLNRDSAGTGAETTEHEFFTWPILMDDGQRQLQNFMFTSMPGTEGDPWEGVINGGQAFSHEILIDGITLGRYDLAGGSNTEFTPSADAVGQFKMQTGALTAQYGAAQTAVTNFVMKSGANDYHGTVYWFHQNKFGRAKTWAENNQGLDKQLAIDNSYGFSVGGPIFKDRTHFFVNFEGEDLRDKRVIGRVNLPAEAFKRGDFSQLFDPEFTGSSQSGSVLGQDALGREVRYGQLYNPATARQLPDGTWILDPFEGNIIPVDQFSDVSASILAMADTPNPDFPGLRRNHPRVARPFREIRTVNFKIDHTINDSHKVSGFFMREERNRSNNGSDRRYHAGWPPEGSSSYQLQSVPGKILRISEDWTINPTTLNHFAFGYNSFINKNHAAVFGQDWPAKIGLTGVGQATFPVINWRGRGFTGDGDYPRLGSGNSTDEANLSFVGMNDLSLIRGSHNFRVGFEIRRYHQNLKDVLDGGSFRFNQTATSQPGFADTGFSYASFLLGAVDVANLRIPLITPGLRVWYNALYFQDDWKLRPNFTVNLGVRWDIPGPLKDVNGNMSAMSPTANNPEFDIPGALTFLKKGESFQDSYFKQFAPRVGFAWNPIENLVVRGGYGLNYSAPLANGWDLDLTNGFNASLDVRRSQAEYREGPAMNWDNGMPPYDVSGYPNTDPAQQNWSSVDYLPADSLRQPYVQNWHLGVQYELPWRTVLEANYVGSKGTRLEDGLFAGQLNQMPLDYLSLGNALWDEIGDHPELPNNSNTDWMPVYMAVKPFPQYYSVQNPHLLGATSNYDSFQVTATRRSETGLSFLAAYTFSKNISSSDAPGVGLYTYQGQDFYNRKNERSLSSFNRPQTLKLSWIYALPFGPGQRWLNEGGLIGHLVGGWTVSAIHSYRSGDPLSIVASAYHWNDWYIGSPSAGWRGDILSGSDSQVLAGGVPNPDAENGAPYLNPEAFGEPPGTDGWIPLRVGTAPRHLPNVRGPAILSEDVSIIKETRLPWREGMSLEFRADIVNFFNRAGRDNPSTDVSSSDFGRIWGNRWGPREAQFGLRLNF